MIWLGFAVVLFGVALLLLWFEVQTISDRLDISRRRVAELEREQAEHERQLRSAARLIGGKLGGGYGA